MKKTNVKRHVRKTKKKIVPVRQHKRKVEKGVKVKNYFPHLKQGNETADATFFPKTQDKKSLEDMKIKLQRMYPDKEIEIFPKNRASQIKECRCGTPYATNDVVCPECRDMINHGIKPYFDASEKEEIKERVKRIQEGFMRIKRIKDEKL